MSAHDIAVNVLVNHQRRNIGSCGCGWSKLGRSFCEHQVEMLEAELNLTSATVMILNSEDEMRTA
jgi:hypothetical protein